MSTTSLPHSIQFRNVLVAPQTPNLQQMKQLRIRTKNKLKDVILPTNPPTPKSKKNQLSKKPINKSKQNMPLIINQNKKLQKNLSFHYLNSNQYNNNNQNNNQSNNQNNQNNYQFNNNNQYTKIKNKQNYQNNEDNDKKFMLINELKNEKKDEQSSQITTLKTSRKIKQNKFTTYNINQNKINDCYNMYTNEYNEKTINIKTGRKEFTVNHIPILHLQNMQKVNTQPESINQYFSPLNNQDDDDFYNSNVIVNNNQQKKAQQLQNFRYRTEIFQKHLVQNQKHLLQYLQRHEHTFIENSSYIQRSFKMLIQQLEQKEHELLNNLFLHQQNIKNTYKQNLNQIISVKKSIQRYKSDIQRHYQDIVYQLEMTEFYKIIKKYDDKLEYFANNISFTINAIQKNKINVYIPIKEIKKVISKSDAKIYQSNIITNMNMNANMNAHSNFNTNPHINFNTNTNNNFNTNAHNNINTNTNSNKNKYSNNNDNHYYQSVEKIHNFNRNSNFNQTQNNHDNTMIYETNKQNHKRNISLKQNNLLMQKAQKKQQKGMFR